MRVVAILTLSGVGVLFAEQTVIDLGPYANLGAIGALTAAFLYLLTRHIPRLHGMTAKQLSEFNGSLEQQRVSYLTLMERLTDRWDRWEQLRHTDHESLQCTLREMTAGCAATRKAMEEQRCDDGK